MSVELAGLSEQVAERLGVSAYRTIATGYDDGDHDRFEQIWFHEDSERCFDLMWKYALRPVQSIVGVTVYDMSGAKIASADLSDFGDDRAVTTRVAIMRAYLTL